MAWLITLLLLIIVLIFIFRAALAPQSAPGKQKRAAGGMYLDGDFGYELHEMMTDTMERIESKIEILRALLKEADQKINALRTINSAASSPRGAGSNREKQNAERTGGEHPARPADNPYKKDLVVQLSRRGMDTAAIARETGLGSGEVEFIVNLEKSRERRR